MTEAVRVIPLPSGRERLDFASSREWLVANGLGGFASSTLSGTVTRRYHGLLVAAMPAPFGRMVMLNQLSERVALPDGRCVPIWGEHTEAAELLTEFHLSNGLPVWRYDIDGIVIEKLVFCTHLQNTTYITYRLISAPQPLRLAFEPSVAFRRQDDPVTSVLGGPYTLAAMEGRFEIAAGTDLPVLRLHLDHRTATMTVGRGSRREIFYPVEAERGYESRGQVWSPGHFTLMLEPGGEATLVASAEPWHNILALSAKDALAYELQRRRRLIATADAKAHAEPGPDLVLAADAYVVLPAGRVGDATRARAAGDEIRTVIAGYHWFTDWGRDTMIGLEGLTLVTGRHTEAGWILRSFATHIREGLIPNMFPEGRHEGLYHTADATLWFFHALDRYLAWTGDRATITLLLPVLKDVIRRHQRGTRFRIGVDPADGLLSEGVEGYQLTWMDAKVGDWVVTPRRGKAVEINALWFNALKLTEGWLRDEGETDDADRMAASAERARESFNRRFWFEAGQHLYDVIDGDNGDDAALRPNQILAISLAHPVLDRSHWEPVMRSVQTRLLTPVGLRTLSPDHPDYQPKYFGDLRARDAAYHQGTVWPWLLGPYVDAWLKLNPDDKPGARRLIEGLLTHIDDAGMGQIAEIFDAEPPFTARGCIAQAWSVAEALRCWWKTS